MINFAEWLKQERNHTQETYKTVADGCGRTPSTVRKYELGKSIPDIDTVQDVLKFFGKELVIRDIGEE